MVVAALAREVGVRVRVVMVAAAVVRVAAVAVFVGLVALGLLCAARAAGRVRACAARSHGQRER